MSSRTEINQSLSSIILFLRLFKSYQIGQLANICQCLAQDPTIYDDKALARLFIQFISHVNEQNKKKHIQQEHMALVIVQSLIYNLFRNNSKNGLNSSIYSNSLMISSNSQIGYFDQSAQSLKHYEGIDDHLTKSFVTFLQDFVGDSDLQKKLKKMIDRGSKKAGENGLNQNQRYTDILFQTIEYILKKQGNLQKNGEFENFKQTLSSKNNNSINSHYEKKNLKILIGQVNKTIFTSKLNCISLLLSEADERVYFSLIRIYFGQSPQEQAGRGKLAKYYGNISYNGEEMLINLIWTYVESISNKNQLFQSSKNPLFRLIQSYLLCFYMPVFRKYNQIVGKCCKYDFGLGLQFYKVCENTINKDLFQFVQHLPIDLVEFLRQIYKIILASQSKQQRREATSNLSSIAIVAVKKLLIFSLLARPELIQSYYSQGVDLQKYEQACNNLINLFFKSSLKKYQKIESDELEIVSTLTKSISNRLEEKIIGSVSTPQEAAYLQQFEETSGVKNYILEQPMLNYDYQVLWERIKNIEFTPKDLKQFEMRKKSDISEAIHAIPTTGNSSLNLTAQTPILNVFSPRQPLQSPMHKGKKDTVQFSQSMEYLENPGDDGDHRQQIDFLTWMAIGGNKDYSNKLNRTNNTTLSRTTRRSRGSFNIESFPKQKMKEVTTLYEQYQKIIL